MNTIIFIVIGIVGMTVSALRHSFLLFNRPGREEVAWAAENIAPSNK